ncbi:MarR family winged helix-turn-helix transcriptional regulator [Nocardia sp. NPDC058176]|uniref:MarR family winged helix-turn-helix transcriptional regulator n=1 Tax=Nocardia sp. NPDC058176 TaxID=3346368 RepID=UPI0036DA20FA
MAVHRQRPPSLLAQPSYLASQVSKFGRQQLETALAERGLRLGHQAVLSALDDFGPLSQQQLADALDLDKSHLVGRIDELQRLGLVTRAQDPADRRRNRIALTDTGEAAAHELHPVAMASQRGFLDALSTAEQQTLTDLLRRVLAANDATRWNES